MAASVGYEIEYGGLRLHYTTRFGGGSPQRIDEVIPVVRTAAQFGGQRDWFQCPACRRRCRLLYGGAHFRCRQCHRARYRSQYESVPLRISRRRWRIRRRLERYGGKPWQLGLDDGFPPKPPHMRWKVYDRLAAQDRDLAECWGLRVNAWLERTDPQRLATKNY